MATERRPKAAAEPFEMDYRGSGSNYKPWITVRSFGSEGISYRPLGRKTGRTHHFVSHGEHCYYLVLERSEIVVDIREQFLIPLSRTLVIAEELGIKHPSAHGQVEEVTTDFVITLEVRGQKSYRARAIKKAEHLSSERVLEKLEIERVFWESVSIDWGIVTDEELPETLHRNLKEFERNLDLPWRLSRSEIDRFDQLLRQLLATVPLAKAAELVDQRLGREIGDTLTVAKHLIATGRWPIDFYRPFQPSRFTLEDIQNDQEEQRHRSIC